MPDACDIELRVRYIEVDQMGALHHSRYWVYYEMGRTELLRLGGIAYADLEKAGIFFVVTKVAGRYQVPVRYDDLLVLSTRITRVGAARIDHAYELKRKSDGVPIASAETTIACIDRAGRVSKIPDFILDACAGATPP